jgi:hypothetical protein
MMLKTLGVLILDSNKPEVKTGKGGLKNLLKNKKFLLVAGGVAIIALLAFYFKNNQSSDTGTISEGITGDYGSGGGGSYGGGTDSYNVPETPTTSTIIDNGKTDNIINVTPILDKAQSQQEASNKIYDLKELWSQTWNTYGQNPNSDQQKILDDIHQQAAQIAKENDLGEGGVEGKYPGLKSDTRTFNSITGAVSGNPTQEIMTESIKTSRVEAQNKISDLGKQWNLTADKTQKDAIHQQAEKIGIEAGLGVGGDSGSERAVVDTKTGAKSKKISK